MAREANPPFPEATFGCSTCLDRGEALREISIDVGDVIGEAPDNRRRRLLVWVENEAVEIKVAQLRRERS